MAITVRSFAKINLGLCIGAVRPDGFHELRTIYQTIALHDIIRVQVSRGTGIQIRCEDPRVPKDESNTCYRIAERAMAVLKAGGRVVIEIEKRLPVQGGLGAASGNAVATLLALEKALKKELPEAERLRIAAEVGSDLPLFVIGGTVLGVGRGEEVYPLPELAAVACVVALPKVSVSTPQAFGDWDRLQGLKPSAAEAVEKSAEINAAPEALRHPKSSVELRSSRMGQRPVPPQSVQFQPSAKLTDRFPSDRILEFGCALAAWLNGPQSGKVSSGVPARGRDRAENPLLDLVRTGIENDFERVVFPQYPELREVKKVLERAGAFYASLSGSGSAIYGLFTSKASAEKAAAKIRAKGTAATVTRTLTRRQYWKKIFD